VGASRSGGTMGYFFDSSFHVPRMEGIAVRVAYQRSSDSPAAERRAAVFVNPLPCAAV